MNTNQLKRFAREARIKLIDQIERKLEYVLTHDSAELRGKQLEIAELRRNINQQGKAHVIDTVAYTWFNRLMALRFMDANGYNVPNVVTPSPGMTNPEILQNAIAGHVEEKLNLDRRYLNDLLDNKTASTEPRSEAYRILLVATCNSLHATMPFMFEPISDYTELLLPDDLLSDYSIVTDIRGGMSDEDCLQEELIGWLYQFYIAQKKDDVFEKLKKNVKITPENIPAATQLFTPRWIVRYMVENTLGKLWLTLRPESRLKDHMSYYIESPEGNEPIPVPEDLIQTSITTDNSQLTTIKFLDPCVGSGHVLVYAFDLLAHMYEEEGYNRNEIPSLILTNNLFGIDIDERAAQLAAFALTMKAQSYYNRFLRKPVQPHIIALENIRIEAIEEAVKLPVKVNGKSITRYPDLSLYLMAEADNFGSLIQIESDEVNSIQIKNGSIWQNQQIKLQHQAGYLCNKYHCVVTNPPYMGLKGMNPSLKDFIQTYFKIYGNDLYLVFMKLCQSFVRENGLFSMINQHGWMFLNSFEEARNDFLDNVRILNMLHLGPRVFEEISGEVVQSTAFTVQKSNFNGLSSFVRLVDIKGPGEKERSLLNKTAKQYNIHQTLFNNLPGRRLCYWLSENELSLLKNDSDFNKYAPPKAGLQTGNNEKFLRFWFEIGIDKIDFNNNVNICSLNKYFPYNKGGGFRRWYGNNLHVVNWEKDGFEIRNYKGAYLRSHSKYFSEGLTWSSLSGNSFALRICQNGFVFDTKGPMCFPNSENIYYTLALGNSLAVNRYLTAFSPTLDFNPGSLGIVPYVFPEKEEFIQISERAKECVGISKAEWDSQEYSYDFKGFNIIDYKGRLLERMVEYEQEVIDNFSTLCNNQIYLNDIFSILYKLDDESKAQYNPISDTTIYTDLLETVDGNYIFKKIEVFYQLFSYFIGCSFGRFSLNKPGLILANEGETLMDFLRHVPQPTFMPDADNVIPVLEDDWFPDDIVGRFKEFIKVAFSNKHLEENIKYIEEVIGKDIRKYFVRDFYPDHIKRYKKRPIYWMFTSPKGHFKALIYLHRYTPNLCSKVLNDYLQPFIGKLDTARQTQVAITLRADVSTREKTKATQRIDTLVAMLKDCRAYEKTLFELATRRIEIDLDDGVKVNYQKFKEVLVPIKGLEKEED